jgi:protein-S-isoprenylcysteine O-methyltransferase Ste14
MDFRSITRVWLVLVLGLVGVGAIFRSAPHTTTCWIGLALALIGLAGVIVARYTLGRSFSVRAKATALVTTGIYSRIRNPIYVSGMFLIAGVLLMIHRPEGFALFLILIPLQVIRARREAAVLEAQFGDAYRQYRQQTWF